MVLVKPEGMICMIAIWNQLLYPIWEGSRRQKGRGVAIYVKSGIISFHITGISEVNGPECLWIIVIQDKAHDRLVVGVCYGLLSYTENRLVHTLSIYKAYIPHLHCPGRLQSSWCMLEVSHGQV